MIKINKIINILAIIIILISIIKKNSSEYMNLKNTNHPKHHIYIGFCGFCIQHRKDSKCEYPRCEDDRKKDKTKRNIPNYDTNISKELVEDSMEK